MLGTAAHQCPLVRLQHVEQPRRVRESRRMQMHATRCSASGGFEDTVSRTFRSASQKFQQFVDDNQLGEKAQAVHSNLNDAAQQVQQQAEELGNQAARKARETFEEADRRMSLRVRVRNVWLYVKTNTPRVQREVLTFIETPLGRVFIFLLALWSAYTGLLLRLINWFFLFVWLSPLFLPIVARMVNKKAMEEAEQQAAAGRPPTGGPFNPGRTAAGGQRYGWYAPPHMRQRQWREEAPQDNQGPRPFWARGPRQQPPQQGTRFSQQPGPVIDAEWETVDD